MIIDNSLMDINISAYSISFTVSPLIMSAPQKFVTPKENRHNIAFSFGITHFGGADIIRGDTVFDL